MKSGIFKRSAVVAALATAGVVAHADALPFNFYALVDVGYGSTTVSSTSVANALNTNSGTTREVRSSGIDPSFWGFTVEKSAGGLTAGFQSESTINVTHMYNTQSSSVPTKLSDRQANLYVKSDKMGKLEAGTVTDPVFDALLTVEPTSSGYGNTINVWFQTVGHSNNSPTSDTGAIKYTTPTVGGFTGKFSYVGSQYSSTTAGANTASLGAGTRIVGLYSAGDFNAVAGYESNNDKTGAVVQNTNLFGASYKMGAVTLKGIYLINRDNRQTVTSDTITPSNGNAIDVTTTTYLIDYGSLKTSGLGGSYDISDKLQFNTGFYQSKDGQSAGHANNTNATMFTSYLTYEMIKDLKVYGEYSTTQNQSTNSNNSFSFTSNYGTAASSATGNVNAGQTAKSIIVGLHYGFF